MLVGPRLEWGRANTVLCRLFVRPEYHASQNWRQNRIMLKEETNRDAHAQGASNYHCVKPTPLYGL